MVTLGRLLDVRLRRWVEHRPTPAVAESRRTRIVDMELSGPLPELVPDGWTDAHAVVRLHGQPLGIVEVDLTAGPAQPEDLRRLVDGTLAEPVAAHLAVDGLSRPDEQPADGAGTHRCILALEPTPPVPLVSVVIPTHNRAGQLASCLESLMALRYPAFEVLVVDNAPADGSTHDLVRDRYGDDPRVRYVHESRAGASLARNLGAELAKGEIVAFTDDDAVVDPLWVSGLVAGFRDDPQVVCVAGLTLPGSLETPAQQAFEVYGGMGLGFERRVYDLTEHRGDTLFYPYTAGIFGASNNVAFRRDDFLARGGFDVTLGPATPAFGAEDLDLFLAVVLDGQRIAYEPVASIRHDHRADFPDLYWQVFTYSAGMTALLTKWFVSDRRIAADMARRVPRLLPAALLRSQRGGEEAGVGEYPSQIRWLERLGYLYGPIAYVRSRLAARRQRR